MSTTPPTRVPKTLNLTKRRDTPPPAASRSPIAVAAFVCGLIALVPFVGGFYFAIPAILLGVFSRRTDAASAWFARTAIALGVSGSVISLGLYLLARSITDQ